jgi:hypothetical protein
MLNPNAIRPHLDRLPNEEVPWEMKRKSDVWQFWAETISAVGSETYPVDPAVVKAIREFEPDFCPLWVTTTYRSPAGGFRVFGRHAIGIDCKNHFQEGKHRPMKVWGATYGVNAGRRPILVEELIENPDVQIIPDVKVFGYSPMDWGFYHKARRSWYEQKLKREQYANDVEAEKEAQAIYSARLEADAKAEKSMNDEADYRFDFVSNKGKKIRDEILGMTHEEYRALGLAR